MSGTQPVGVYALKVPPGDILIPGCPEFAAMYRVSMAAIDPSVEPQTEDVEDAAKPRATLKIVRFPDFDSEDEEDSEDEDEDSEDDLDLLNGVDDDDDEDMPNGELNGEPSNSKFSKKSKVKTKQEDDEETGDASEDEEDDDEEDDEIAKALLMKIMKGKAKAEDDADDENSDEDDEELGVEETVVCTLDPEKQHQQTLDITISEGERVFFKVSGTHVVHLTGNYIVPTEEPHVYPYDEDEEGYDFAPDEDELDEEDLAALEDEDDESDELDDLPNPSRITEVQSDDEDKFKFTTKASSKGKNKRPAEDSAEEEEEALDDMIAKAKAAEDKPPESLHITADGQPKKLSKAEKKRLKKLKANDGKATDAPTTDNKPTGKKPETPTTNGTPVEKKVQFAKNLEQGPTASSSPKTGSTTASQPSNMSKKSSLGVRDVDGVTVDDRKLGAGKQAKSGDRVEMRYIGKLENGKVFDSNKSGKPFAFKLGLGDVIKGWDIGVAGLSVGGERRLTIPAHLGYGKKGAPPDIPPNSKLIFDIKCLSVK